MPKKKENVKKKPNLTEVGGTGTSIFSGIYNEEYLTKLKGHTAITTYDKMRRSDGMIGAVLLALELPIKTAEWSVKADEDVPQEMQDFLSEALFERMSITWRQFIHHVMLMMAFGYSVFEKVYKIEDGRVWWKKLAPRMQTSLRKWHLDDTGGLSGITQYVLKNGVYVNVDIDVEKLLVFSFRREGSNYEGISVLRHAYKHWLIKDALYKISGIGMERQGAGVPVIKLAEGYSDADKDAAETIVENIRINDDSGVVLPPGFEFEIVEGKMDAEGILAHIQHHDTKIAQCVLAEFLQLGMESSGGSYALSKDKSDFFMMILESICTDIVEDINRYAIKPLIDMNFASVKKYPELTYSLGRVDVGKLIEGLDKLVNRKIVVPQDADEEWIRNELGLPQIDEDREEVDRMPAAPQLQIAQMQQEAEAKAATVPKKKVKASEAGGYQFAERQLTKFEKAVNFGEISDRFDRAEKEMIKAMFGVAETQIEDLVRQIERAVSTGKINELYKLTVRYRGDYVSTLKTYMQDLANFGFAQAQTETGITIENISQQLKNWMTIKADTIVELHAAKMKSSAMLTTLNSINAGRTTLGTTYDVRKFLEEAAKRELKGTASMTVAESVNMGRQEIVNSGKIKYAQYSAILDMKTCPLCETMDEMIVSVDNPDFKRFSPPVHANCRCIWVYIGEEEEGVEETWKAPDGNLIARHGHLIA